MYKKVKNTLAKIGNKYYNGNCEMLPDQSCIGKEA